MCTKGGACSEKTGRHFRLFPEDFAAEKLNLNSTSWQTDLLLIQDSFPGVRSRVTATGEYRDEFSPDVLHPYAHRW